MTNKEAIEILENIPFTERALERICAVNMAIDALHKINEPKKLFNLRLGELTSYILPGTSIRLLDDINDDVVLDTVFIEELHSSWNRFRVWHIDPVVACDDDWDDADSHYSRLDITILTEDEPE